MQKPLPEKLPSVFAEGKSGRVAAETPRPADAHAHVTERGACSPES